MQDHLKKTKKIGKWSLFLFWIFPKQYLLSLSWLKLDFLFTFSKRYIYMYIYINLFNLQLIQRARDKRLTDHQGNEGQTFLLSLSLSLSLSLYIVKTISKFASFYCFELIVLSL